MRRLAIIDVKTGRQPIYNEDRSVAVVFNGEIYNFRGLKVDLERKGHRFETQSDTEVIVHLYEELGEEFVDRLIGMFGIALWDRRKRKLLLARDRLGVKPVYYHVGSDRIVFGSEIKAVLQDDGVPRRPDYNGLDDMMTYGYTVAPRTCFEEILELPPASVLTYSEGQHRVKCYWDITYAPKEPYDEETALNELQVRLEEATRLRMISDVPIGVLLSGGIDSSVVTAIMARLSGQPVKTFSIGFGESDFSEISFARLVAKMYETEHHEYVVKPDVGELVPKLIYHHDQPFFDTSAIPMFYVSKMASQEVKVSLSGDGGDELFAGYNIYKADKAASYYRRIPRYISRTLLKSLAEAVPESTRFINPGRIAREFVAGAELDSNGAYIRWVSKIKPETRMHLYLAPGLRETLSATPGRHLIALFDRQRNASRLSQLMYVDAHTELSSDILVKVDRMSMANSLEVRSPLLDHTLWEFVATLPDQSKLKGWRSKHLLKELARRLVPSPLLTRTKRGFSVPLDLWFRTSLSGWAQEIIFDPTTEARGLFNMQFVRGLVDDHMSGRRGYGRELWMMVSIELWYRMYIDRFEYADSKCASDLPPLALPASG